MAAAACLTGEGTADQATSLSELLAVRAREKGEVRRAASSRKGTAHTAAIVVIGIVVKIGDAVVGLQHQVRGDEGLLRKPKASGLALR